MYAPVRGLYCAIATDADAPVSLPENELGATAWPGTGCDGGTGDEPTGGVVSSTGDAGVGAGASGAGGTPGGKGVPSIGA